MEFNSIGTAGLTGQTLTGHSIQKAEMYAASKSPEVEGPEKHDHHGHRKSRGHHGHHGHRGHHALGALRQEIRLALSSSFQMRFSTTTAAYNQVAGEQSPSDVAAEALGAAKEVASRAPLEASETLVDMRRKIDVAAKNVRESVGVEPQDELNGAIDLVDKGLDELEQDAARNTVSSASVLSAETETRQRSTIRIRTQEGDMIKLSLRNVERMSIEDASTTEGDANVRSTEIQVSNRSRMMLRVNGDLNEAEMTAIKAVFEQAEAIADEFFGGDLAAAFDMAAGLEYDTEQLAKINMRFRERQVSTVSYAVTGAPPAAIAKEADPVIAAPSTPVVEKVEPAPVAATEVAPETEAASTEAPPETNPGASVPSDNAMDNFFDLLGNFLSSLNEGFESDSGGMSFRFFHSQSFSLQILKTVFELNAPEESGDAAQTAAKVVDSITE